MEITIADRKIGENYKPYIIAELSANHHGKLENAIEMIALAKSTGVDAIKIQTYTPDTMTLKSDRDDFIIKGGTWDGYSLYDLYSKAYTPFEWHKTLFDEAKRQGIVLFSSPFDETAVDLLESLNTPAYKIASFECTDLPLIDYVASKNKPIIISTGMANIDEIQEALDTIRKHHNQVIVLHCVSAYPATPDIYHLKTLKDLKDKFNVLTGLSDHTLGTVTSVTSVALGGVLIEKHFTKDRSEGGFDSSFSLEPNEFKKLVEDSTIAWQALGKVKNFDLKGSEKTYINYRRSIYFSKDLEKGDVITKDNIRRIRPGFGLKPKYYDDIIGKKIKRSVKRATPVTWEVLE